MGGILQEKNAGMEEARGYPRSLQYQLLESVNPGLIAIIAAIATESSSAAIASSAAITIAIATK